MSEELIIHSVVQGSPEWEALRENTDNASEAAAVMGLSSKTMRSEMVRMKALGLKKEFSQFVREKILDRGHELEAMARPIIEETEYDGEIIGDLYPVTCSRGRRGASCDGLTMDQRIAFEHKQWNEALAAEVRAGRVPDEHMPQCQQILFVTGAEVVRFVVSDGTPQKMFYVDVFPDSVWQDRIDQAWAFFHADVSAYVYVEEAAAPVAKQQSALPALIVSIKGEVVDSNYDEYVAIARERIGSINTKLETDQDFADADAAAKFCRESSKEMQTVKKLALSQTASIAQLLAAMDSISTEFDAKGLELEKLVKARKESRKVEIVQEGKDGLAAYLKTFEPRSCYAYMPQITADFAAAIKGKSKFANMKDAVSVALTNAKMEANEVATLIEANLSALDKIAPNRMALFPDLRTLVIKPLDDFKTLIEARVLKADADEKERVDRLAEQARERIRLEEQAKALTPAPDEKIDQDTGEITPAPVLTGIGGPRPQIAGSTYAKASPAKFQGTPCRSEKESRDSLITKIVDLLEDYTDDELRNLYTQMTTAAAPF